jgi:hypothetical protein
LAAALLIGVVQGLSQRVVAGLPAADGGDVNAGGGRGFAECRAGPSRGQQALDDCLAIPPRLEGIRHRASGAYGPSVNLFARRAPARSPKPEDKPIENRRLSSASEAAVIRYLQVGRLRKSAEK